MPFPKGYQGNYIPTGWEKKELSQTNRKSKNNQDEMKLAMDFLKHL